MLLGHQAGLGNICNCDVHPWAQSPRWGPSFPRMGHLWPCHWKQGLGPPELLVRTQTSIRMAMTLALQFTLLFQHATLILTPHSLVENKRNFQAVGCCFFPREAWLGLPIPCESKADVARCTQRFPLHTRASHPSPLLWVQFDLVMSCFRTLRKKGLHLCCLSVLKQLCIEAGRASASCTVRVALPRWAQDQKGRRRPWGNWLRLSVKLSLKSALLHSPLFSCSYCKR